MTFSKSHLLGPATIKMPKNKIIYCSYTWCFFSNDSIFNYFSNKHQFVRRLEHTNKKSDFIEFSEFIEYLINTKVVFWDKHFLPIYLTCSPCLFPFNTVIKAESFKGKSTVFKPN